MRSLLRDTNVVYSVRRPRIVKYISNLTPGIILAALPAMPSVAEDVSSFRSRVLDSVYWLTWSRLTAQFITWLITIWVIRILSPADYGLMAMATVFISAGALIDELGLGSMITRATEIDETSLRKVFGIVLAINVALCVSLLLGARAVAVFYGSTDVTPLVQVLSFQFLASALVVVPRALMERALEFRKLASAELIVSLLGCASTLLLAVNGYGVWSLVIGNLVMTFARAGILTLLRPFLRLPLFSLRGMRDFVAFGGTVSLERVLWYLYSQADILIAGKLLGGQALGFYVVGKQFASLPSQKMSPIIQQVTFPAVARIQHDRARVGRSLLLGVNTISVFFCPILFGMAALGEDLILVVLGSQWAPASLLLTTYGLIVPLGMVSSIILSALKAVGRPDLSVKNVTLGSALMIVAFTLGSRAGLAGLSIAWLAAYPVYFLATVVRSAPTLGTTARALLSRIGRPLVASAIMLVLVAALRPPVEGMLAHEAARLGVLIAIGVIVYGASMAAFGRSSLVEAMGLVMRKRHAT